MRRMSPCTRIMGGRPEDRCRSEALFLTTKARSSEISTIIPFNVRPERNPKQGPKQMKEREFSGSPRSHRRADYVLNTLELASREAAHRIRDPGGGQRSEEHTSELQSRLHLVCRLLLEKKKKKN